MARKAKAKVEVVAPAIVETTEVVVETTEVVAEPINELTALLTTPVIEVVEDKKPVVAKNQGVGKYVRELIADGLTNTEILKRVHTEYGNENTTYACVAWYRNKMKKAQRVASQSKAAAVVEKFMKADEAFKETPEISDLNDEDLDGELESADELRQLVGQ